VKVTVEITTEPHQQEMEVNQESMELTDSHCGQESNMEILELRLLEAFAR
jgi:hypothetical protein